MRMFAPGTLSANMTSFRDLILIKYYVCSYLFQKTLEMTQSFKKNYELCRLVSDLDCYNCIWDKMQFMVKILVFGFNFSVVQKIFQIVLIWSPRFSQLKSGSNMPFTTWCKPRGMVGGSMRLTYSEREELNLLVIFY